MVGKGFIFLESYENTRLYVFKKTDLENKKRFDSIPKSSKLFKIKKHLKALINEILSWIFLEKQHIELKRNFLKNW